MTRKDERELKQVIATADQGSHLTDQEIFLAARDAAVLAHEAGRDGYQAAMAVVDRYCGTGPSRDPRDR